ncbi:hypothetical protein E2C01_061736 [Portunus trituberculatus]|uniref:Uncharacterized protein n=1 Tax=Portunus trituberculatus TaxID=210409 RepID=A0A5B7HF76_PORTR|nr:hypothetical protein [Portunus trituberculatus]
MAMMTVEVVVVVVLVQTTCPSVRGSRGSRVRQPPLYVSSPSSSLHVLLVFILLGHTVLLAVQVVIHEAAVHGGDGGKSRQASWY